MSTEVATEVAAILEAFVASQRADAIATATKQRVVFARQVVGGRQIQLEMVVDENIAAEELYDRVSRVEQCADRLQARLDIVAYYEKIMEHCGELDVTRRQMAEEEASAIAKNAARNANRRVPIVMTVQEKSNLENRRTSIKETFARISELEASIAECRRVLGGEEPFEVMADKVAERLDGIRGTRPAAVA